MGDKYGMRNWSVVYVGSDPYKAPEQCSACLSGEVVDHPSRPDGDRVTTSAIVEAAGRNVKTYSGSVITLVGDPHPDYVAYCQAQGVAIDMDAPIKVHTVH